MHSRVALSRFQFLPLGIPGLSRVAVAGGLRLLKVWKSMLTTHLSYPSLCSGLCSSWKDFSSFFVLVKKHDIQIKSKSQKLELLEELVV